jgi:hypothetical protein
MKGRSVSLLAALLVAGCLAPARAQTPGKVCFDPARPCPGFKAHDLSFALAADGTARAQQRSAPFFAVILQTPARCRAGEKERQELQALFPDHKVFMTRFECDDNPENNVTYANVDAKRGFIAVYGGEHRAVAAEVLAKAKALNRFPGANLRRMEVVYVYP